MRGVGERTHEHQRARPQVAAQTQVQSDRSAHRTARDHKTAGAPIEAFAHNIFFDVPREMAQAIFAADGTVDGLRQMQIRDGAQRPLLDIAAAIHSQTRNQNHRRRGTVRAAIGAFGRTQHLDRFETARFKCFNGHLAVVRVGRQRQRGMRNFFDGGRANAIAGPCELNDHECVPSNKMNYGAWKIRARHRYGINFTRILHAFKTISSRLIHGRQALTTHFDSRAGLGR